MKMAWATVAIHVMLVGVMTMTSCAAPNAPKAVQVSTAHREVSGQRLSQGCGRLAPKTPPTSLMVAGRRRQFILVVPKDKSTGEPQRLVFAFHGRTNNNAKVRGYYDLERHTAQPTLFVYPNGLKDRSGRFTWSAPRDPAHALRDYAFFDALLAEIGNRYCVTLDHVYIVGHSLGA